ncbi:MAG: glutamine-hydrolyzing GMP synthase, partial [Candidatus Zixiibacteriota bacterium]
MKSPHEMVVILDFGSQYTQLIARRIREAHVYCEIVPYNVNLTQYEDAKVRGYILSGGPASLSDPDTPRLDPSFFEIGKPILGICYGMQLLGDQFGGKLARSDTREYGRAQFTVINDAALLSGIPQHSQVWMSHGDSIVELPKGFQLIGSTDSLEVAAIANHEKKIYGVQFHPEVHHTEEGRSILHNYLFE